MFKASIAASLTVCALLLSAASAIASPIRIGFDAHDLGRTDDGSSALTDLGFSIDFFGASHDAAYVNNNGNITFDGALRQFSPSALDQIESSIIAPFFADVDTANDSIGETVTYGQGTVNGRAAFGVNWLDVNYFNNFDKHDQLNSFQLVLVDRSDTGEGNFDIEFNYDSILWEAGTASGGDALGLGGNAARAGFSAGTGIEGSYVELEGSAVNGGFINGGSYALNNSSNVGIDGRFLFAIREGDITLPGVSIVATPLPTGLPLLLGGVGLLALIRRKRA